MLITCIWTGVIFSFSLQPAEVSNETSMGVGNFLLETFFPWLYDTWEEMPLAQKDMLHFVLRKCAHFSEYFVLGALAIWTWYQTKRGHSRAVAWGHCFLIASLDECLQLFVGGRSGQFRDVLLDSVGALAGILVLSFIRLKFLSGRKE